MRAYLWKVICAAVVCALADCIGTGGPGKAVRKLVCGAFLILTLLSPLDGAALPKLELQSLNRTADAIVRDGTAQAEKARYEIISDACAAYILNKAGALGLTVEVELDEAGFPIRAVLTGDASPLERRTLTEAIVRELGIREEEIRWMESHQSSE